jgi:hypothetical protein
MPMVRGTTACGESRINSAPVEMPLPLPQAAFHVLVALADQDRHASMEPTGDAAAIADAYVNSGRCFARRLESLADESAGSADALQLDPVWADHMRARRNGKIADVRRRRAVSSLHAAIWLIRLAKTAEARQWLAIAADEPETQDRARQLLREIGGN